MSSTLDSLAGDDLRAMFGPQLLDRAGELLRARSRLDAELIRTVRECELIQASGRDGLTSMQSWLRGPGHLSDAEAGRLLRSGRALEQLPAVAAGFADGAITAGQVALTAPIADPDRLAAAAERDIDVAAIDTALAATAASAPHATVKLAVGTAWPASTPTARSRIPPRAGR